MKKENKKYFYKHNILYIYYLFIFIFPSKKIIYISMN